MLVLLALGTIAAGPATVYAAEQAPTCVDWVRMRGTVPGRDAPVVRIGAGKRTTVGVAVHSCTARSWFGYTLKREGGTVGPSSVGVTSRLISRTLNLKLQITAPTEAGTYFVSYSLTDRDGALFAQSVGITIEVLPPPPDCATLSVIRRAGDPTSGPYVLKPGGALLPTLKAENCSSLIVWRGYRIERTSADSIGPSVLSLTTVEPRRATVAVAGIRAPTRPGTYAVTYQIKGPRGAVGEPYTIELLVQ